MPKNLSGAEDIELVDRHSDDPDIINTETQIIYLPETENEPPFEQRESEAATLNETFAKFKSRKRVRNPTHWKKHIQKNKQTKGEEYNLLQVERELKSVSVGLPTAPVVG